MEFLARIDDERKKGELTEKAAISLQEFYLSYLETFQHYGRNYQDYAHLLDFYITEVVKQCKTPHAFQPYHQKVTEPIDYYTFGLMFIKSLLIEETSTVKGQENLLRMTQQLRNKENVILFANHQTEPDPQIISLLLKNRGFHEVDKMIFVAGDRVVTDPLAIPFSMGCNLLCIYSKKHIDNPPELKEFKLLHNQKTMKQMSELLTEGGKWIYVAPSGGRDRADGHGVVNIDRFDPQSIEMFYLMAQKAETPTHFYPLALNTYSILPPPSSVEVEIGEKRTTKCHPAHLHFGSEIEMEKFPGSEEKDKKTRRTLRANNIWEQVNTLYQQLPQSP